MFSFLNVSQLSLDSFLVLLFPNESVSRIRDNDRHLGFVTFVKYEILSHHDEGNEDMNIRVMTSQKFCM
jgi:hypothetical protein